MNTSESYSKSEGYEFSTLEIEVPKHDFDVVLRWPGGQEITIQARPSNADVNGYAGSFDIILPDDRAVSCHEGDDLEPAKPAHPKTKNCLMAKQLITDMQDSWYEQEEIPKEDGEPIIFPSEGFGGSC